MHHYFRVSVVLLAAPSIACGGAGEKETREPETAPPTQGPADSSAAVTTPAITRPGDIAGFVFEDRNRNGRFDTGDVRMAEQAVVLTNPAATERISSTTTDVDGTFRFETLPPADYRITLEIPDTFQRTNDDSFLVTVTTDGSIPELAFGIAGR